MKIRALAISAAALLAGCGAGETSSPEIAATKPIAFVQLFEWRWNDIARECENFLGEAGYTAVQVSPPNEHVQGPAWWTRYQPVSYKIESRGGTREEFADMVARCKAAGVDIYADAVINHMAGYPEGVGVAGSPFSEYDYPAVPYDVDDFHQCGRNETDKIVDYQDLWEVQSCQLGTLDDIDTGKPQVQARIAAYLNDLSGLGVAGFRLDAVKHIHHDELHAILQQVDGEPFVYQEVIDRGGEPISAKDYVRDGRVTEFKYPQVILDAFEKGELDGLDAFWMHTGWLLGSEAVVFVDNHDIQRGHAFGDEVVNYKDGIRHELAVAFMLAHPWGYPLVMSSYAFDTDQDGPPAISPHEVGGCGEAWVCEHRRDLTVAMLRFRAATQHAKSLQFEIIDDAIISIGREDKGHVWINTSEQPMEINTPTDLGPGLYTNLVDGGAVSIDDPPIITLTLEPLSVVALLADSE